MEELLTVADVARLARTTPDAVRRAAREARIQIAGRTRGGVRLFRAEEARRFAELTRARRRRSGGSRA